MLEKLSRTQAAILLALIVLALGWSLTIRSVPAHPDQIIEKNYNDRQLYRDIAKRVSAGDTYYLAATSLQRQHYYPTRPFVAVRLPTLTWLGAAFGWHAMQITMLALLCLAIAAWYPLFGSVTRVEAIVGSLAVFLGGAFATQIELAVMHEIWAGFLIAIALALRRRPVWWLSVVCVAMALAIREFALTYVALAGVVALWERRWREVACWAVLTGAFAAGIAMHAREVIAMVRPGDLPSPGWHGLRGPQAVLQDLATHSLLSPFPPPLVYMLGLLGPIGLLGLPAREGRFALAWMLLYTLMIALAARPQNDYWCMALLPTWFIGYAFLPRVALRITGALAGRNSGL